MAGDPLRTFRFVPQAPPTAGRIALGPTRYGWWFASAMLVMLLASLNYNLNLGFGLTFLLLGACLAACMQTRRALRGVQLRPAASPAVYAGGQALFPVQALAPTERLAVGLSFALEEDLPGRDVPAASPQLFTLAMPAPHRGRLRPGPVVLQTVWPLGLFRAWTVVELELECLVWPAPAVPLPEFVHAGGSQGHGQAGGPGVEDFKEVRPYVPGDAPQRVSWKASTRGQGLFVKEFEGLIGQTVLLDLAAMPGPDLETRLGVLCGQILKAHGLGLPFVLQLPGRRLEPDGPGADLHAHKRRCLDALATYRPHVYGPGGDGAV